jgi:hypothetical protein
MSLFILTVEVWEESPSAEERMANVVQKLVMLQKNCTQICIQLVSFGADRVRLKTILENMPKRIVAPSPEDILGTGVDEAPPRDEALAQSQNRGSTDIMLAAQPRIYDR